MEAAAADLLALFEREEDRKPEAEVDSPAGPRAATGRRMKTEHHRVTACYVVRTPDAARPPAADDIQESTPIQEVGLSAESVTISARFPSELIREAQRLGELEDRSVSWLLRQALKERLEREQSPERQAK
ncbi:MAG TPA: hypothetical protein VMH88_13085 [Gemmatimonadales bacterium]|nr:hypothetical protein [Gemmatimonadales bacterium]